MPKTNPANEPAREIKIVRELLNSYLVIRLEEADDRWIGDGWSGIDLTNIPSEGTQHDKLAIVMELDKIIPFLDIKQDAQAWFNFIYELAKLEESERAIKESKGTLFGIRMPGRRFDSMLERTMHAIRTFIIQEIKNCEKLDGFGSGKELLDENEKAFDDQVKLQLRKRASTKADPHADQKSIADLEDSIVESNRHFDALVKGENAPYHNIHFDAEIKLRDQHKDKRGVPQLHESSFEDYCNNVMNGNRSPEYLNQLCNPKAAPDKSPLQENSTFSASKHSTKSAATKHNAKKKKYHT